MRPMSVKSAVARWLDEFKAREASLVEQAVPAAAAALKIYIPTSSGGISPSSGGASTNGISAVRNDFSRPWSGLAEHPFSGSRREMNDARKLK
jgi:hypothetical protein